jgi:hypothetical protein
VILKKLGLWINRSVGISVAVKMVSEDDLSGRKKLSIIIEMPISSVFGRPLALWPSSAFPQLLMV